MKVSWGALATLVTAIILFLATASAQELSLSGTVRDIVGVVPDATVTLRAAGSDTPVTATTGPTGNYTFSALAPGYYELSFAKEGFDTITRNLTLNANTGPVDVTFAVGAVSASITVIDVAGKSTASRLEIPDRDLPVQVTASPNSCCSSKVSMTWLPR